MFPLRGVYERRMKPEPVIVQNTGEVARFSNGAEIVRVRVSLNREFADIIDMVVCHTAFQAIFAPGTSLSECKRKWADPELRSQPVSEGSSYWTKEERIAISHGYPRSRQD